MKLFFSNYWQNPQITSAVHYFQKQLCKKRCSEKVRKFHKKTPVLDSAFNKVAGFWTCKFIKKKLQHKFFPANFSKFLRTPILKNICERLLPYFHYNSHHDCDHHHFHYYCKIHLYHLRILLIPLDCKIIPGLFQLNFVFFILAYIFL